MPADVGSVPAPAGRLDARYLAFLATLTELRPSLHRYCARMTGSVLDGEDVVQESLLQAYRKLDSFVATRRLKPWLFRIAHNRCIDFLRQRETRTRAEAESVVGDSDVAPPAEPVGVGLGSAVEHLVVSLPPKERACILLKDVFEYSLEEIAELVDSTTGGVKAALHRARAKLAARPPAPPTVSNHSDTDKTLLRLYVERFNQRDWTGVRELIAADARLLVVDRFAGAVADSPYFSTYERIPATWRLAVGEIEGMPTIIIQEQAGKSWVPKTLVQLQISGGKINRITDYWYCPWVVATATSLVLEEAS